jgi:hypothetical protein
VRSTARCCRSRSPTTGTAFLVVEIRNQVGD